MSLNWESFKNQFIKFEEVTYLDDENDEIPINNQCEFDEAVKLAKLQEKTHLNIIIRHKGCKTAKTISLYEQNEKKERENSNVTEENKVNMSENIVNLNQNPYFCSVDLPPIWFTQYMKKFKKEILKEFKKITLETIRNASETKQESVHNIKPEQEPVIQCSEQSPKSKSSGTEKKKKKKKLNEDFTFFDHRDSKTLKKLDKLTSNKFEKLENKLEKLDIKSKNLLEEKKKLFDKKRLSKLMSERKDIDKPNKVGMKAARISIRPIHLVSGQEFFESFRITNTGDIVLSNPTLLCKSTGVISFDCEIQKFPPVTPKEKFCFDLSGIVANNTVGEFTFSCIFMDGCDVLFSKPMMVNVLPNRTQNMYLTSSQGVSSVVSDNLYLENKQLSKQSSGKQNETSTNMNGSIYFNEKDIFSSSHEKIEANIMEIQKRLNDIDLQFSQKPGDPKDAVELENILENSQTVDETNLKGFSEKYTNPGFLFKKNGSDIDCTPQLEKITDEGKTNTINTADEETPIRSECTSNNLEASGFEKVTKNGDIEEGTDSEISIIFISEEEDEVGDGNFIVVTGPSDISNAESVNTENSEKNKTELSSEIEKKLEGKIFGALYPDLSKEYSKDLPEEFRSKTNDFMENVIFEEQNAKNGEDSAPNHTSNRRSRDEDRNEFKTKKMKSNRSTEYVFSTDARNWTAFTPSFVQPNESAFTFTGKSKKNLPKRETKTRINTEESFLSSDVPTIDSLGRLIYAVNKEGYCLPVETLLYSEKDVEAPKFLDVGDKRKKKNGKQDKTEKPDKDDKFQQTFSNLRNDHTNTESPVNILPNAFMNGASNMASLALNTAKSVLNNLQFAYSVVKEGKTELGQPATEQQQKKDEAFMEALLKLYEMGFTDFELNKKLLEAQNNNLQKVIDDLF